MGDPSASGWNPKDYPMLGELGTLPLAKKLLLAAPMLGWYAVQYMKLSYMKVFYVNGHPRASIGYIALFTVAAVLVDTFSDPYMANWTDNCRPRSLGRRRPFVLAGGLCALVVSCLGYVPLLPAGVGASLWFGAFHVLSKLCETLLIIPMQSWVAEASPSAVERNSLWMLYWVLSVVGILLGAVLPGFLGKLGGQDCFSANSGCVALPLLAFCFGSFLLTACCCLALRGRERPNERLPKPERVSWSQDGVVPSIVAAWLNRPFRCLLVCASVRAFGQELPFVILPFLTRGLLGEACLGGGLSYSLLAGANLLSRIASMPLWVLLARRAGKYNAYLTFLFGMALSQVLFVSIQRDTGDCVQTVWSIALAALWGISFGGLFLGQSMLSDVVDYDELLGGRRREAMYLMSMELPAKFLSVFTEAIPLLLLAYLGYVRPEGDGPAPLQPAAVVWLLRLCLSLVPGIIISAAGVALFWYPKRARPEEAHRQVLLAIEQHRQGLSTQDPWTGRPIAPPSEPPPHAGLLSHLFPSEIYAMANGKTSAPMAGIFCWLSASVPLSVLGVALMLAGWQDLGDDLGASLSPVGLILLGFAAMLVWFHGTRALALRQILKEDVPRADLLAHYAYLCRFTGQAPLQ